VKTRVSLTGTLIVARDAATPSSRSGWIAAKTCRNISKQSPVYYAGPAKTPVGYASGAFGPTTAGRMDSYV